MMRFKKIKKPAFALGKTGYEIVGKDAPGTEAWRSITRS
jgi:hypothetical protein